MFSPTILNELHFGFVRLNFLSVGGGLNGTDALHTVAGKQDMDWDPGQGLTAIGPPPSSPGANATNRFSVGDDVVLTKGAHSLHVGILFTRVQTNALAEGYSGGWNLFVGLNGIPLVGFGEGGGPPFLAAGGSMQGSPFVAFMGVDPSYTYTTPNGTSYPWTPMTLLASELAGPLHPGRLEDQ